MKESTVVRLISTRNFVSLQDPIGEHGDTLADVVPDTGKNVADELAQASTFGFLNEQLQLLNPQERKIIELRYYKDQTLEEVGKIFQLTRERIRQIEFKALRKLRSGPRFKQMQEIA